MDKRDLRSDPLTWRQRWACPTPGPTKCRRCQTKLATPAILGYMISNESGKCFFIRKSYEEILVFLRGQSYINNFTILEVNQIKRSFFHREEGILDQPTIKKPGPTIPTIMDRTSWMLHHGFNVCRMHRCPRWSVLTVHLSGFLTTRAMSLKHVPTFLSFLKQVMICQTNVFLFNIVPPTRLTFAADHALILCRSSSLNGCFKKTLPGSQSDMLTVGRLGWDP